ncbi:hypothetical protein EPH95_08775 [Salicibibacter halophilus]|uniref:Uncharacterized protein n=1 Tax=Salicibibacter halophilus TaxID=2502791 RepID=A0A514LHD3_9BACI|nr:hypothetical protein [Salicibibacter halophilus]QDI91266.1 hypothetical protein EPH95_08775 [Salicibibacter halophilus]
MVRDVFRLAWFEWKNVSIRGVVGALFVLICYAILLVFVAGLAEDEGIAILLDFWFILASILWLGMSQFSGAPFNIAKMNDHLLSTPFYRYAKRLPVSEVALFRSRLLVKVVYLTVLTFAMVSLAVIFVPNPFPFSLGDNIFISFAAFWVAIAMISTMNAINEIGYSLKEDTKMNLKSFAWMIGFLVFYLVIWIWLIPYNGTFVQFTIEYSAANPTAMLGISIAIVLVTLFLVEYGGRKKIRKQGYRR